MSRFQWISEDSFKVINIEGIERIVSVPEFKEIKYNMDTYYNLQEVDDGRHYYLNRMPLQLEDVVGRLQRKQEIYKSHLYLTDKHRPFQFY